MLQKVILQNNKGLQLSKVLTAARQRRWYTDLCTAGQAVELLALHHAVVMLLMQKGQRSTIVNLNLLSTVPLLIFCLQIC
jgi:hypothetical protein